MDVRDISRSLEESLFKGWEEFRKSPLFDKYYKLTERLDWYNSDLNEVIPHPAYMLATLQIGKYFIKKARELEISFDEIFPGNFEESIEDYDHNMPVRHFHINAYHNNQCLGLIILSFYHLHDTFDFPDPPKIQIKN